MKRQGVGYRQLQLIDVTPHPTFAGLERGHHRVMGSVEVFCCVVPWRAVTTADVSAREAETQVKPARTSLQTFFTTESPGPNGLEADQMLAAHCFPSPGRPAVIHERSILKLATRDGKVAPIFAWGEWLKERSVRS